MKKTLNTLTSLFLVLVMVLSFAACNTVDAKGLWENATYRKDTELGEGAKTIQVEVKAEDQAITVTIKTDAENLEDALTGVKLVSGDDSEFGLYIKVVNGITADYDVNQSFWGLYKDGKMTPAGAHDTLIKDGEHYELVYSK